MRRILCVNASSEWDRIAVSGVLLRENFFPLKPLKVQPMPIAYIWRIKFEDKYKVIVKLQLLHFWYCDK